MNNPLLILSFKNILKMHLVNMKAENTQNLQLKCF